MWQNVRKWLVYSSSVKHSIPSSSVFFELPNAELIGVDITSHTRPKLCNTMCGAFHEGVNRYDRSVNKSTYARKNEGDW